jgi:hypothetical protein
MKVLPFLVPVLLAAGCSNAEHQRLVETTRSTYDPATGKLRELTYDANKNGRIDTWTQMDGALPVSTRQDLDEDGRIDRWEYYDKAGQLLKVGFSRKDDGQADGWAYAGPGGGLERIELSNRGNGAVDRWERYDTTGLIAADEDTDRDGVPDKWETYSHGVLLTASFDETGDGRPDRLLTYEAGTLVAIATAPDASGRFMKKIDVRRPDDSPHRP